MNIWQEVEKRFPALQPDDEELTVKVFELRSFRRSAFHSGAEWARKEALREAEAAVNENRLFDDTGNPVDVGYTAALDDALEVIRALAGKA